MGIYAQGIIEALRYKKQQEDAAHARRKAERDAAAKAGGNILGAALGGIGGFITGGPVGAALGATSGYLSGKSSDTGVDAVKGGLSGYQAGTGYTSATEAAAEKAANLPLETMEKTKALMENYEPYFPTEEELKQIEEGIIPGGVSQFPSIVESVYGTRYFKPKAKTPPFVVNVGGQ